MDVTSVLHLVHTVLAQAPAEAVEVATETTQASAGISGDDLRTAGALIGAGSCMGFGAIGPGIGEGFAAGKACAHDAQQRGTGENAHERTHREHPILQPLRPEGRTAGPI